MRNDSDETLKQYVWAAPGSGYIDELVQTSVNSDPGDSLEQECESHYWALQDANFNLLGVVNASGDLVERYEYTPYGERTVFFSPGSNDPLLYSATGASRRVSIGSTDQPYGLLEMGHQGLLHDEETGLVYNRARMRTTDGRWMRREPLGYPIHHQRLLRIRRVVLVTMRVMRKMTAIPVSMMVTVLNVQSSEVD